MHTKRFSIISTKKSNRPSNIQSFNGSLGESARVDWLIVFACVEAGDDPSNCGKAADIVIELAKRIHPPGIAVVPFAHLSSQLMKSSRLAYSLLSDLVGIIKEKYDCEVAIGDFGYFSNMEVLTHSHAMSIAYREI